ncbi:MAG: ABC transporter permease [Candidatus Izemoplasmatales bacterium]|jgi:ABC-type uncharacterized transport system permease subunit
MMMLAYSIYDLIGSTITTMIPLLIVAIGAMICERSGVTNIALEGIMIMGAFVSVWVISIIEPATNEAALAQSNWQKSGLLILGMLIGGITGLLFSWLHAYASISMKADQTISATALNLIAPALAFYIARTVIGGKQIFFKTVFKMQSVGFLGDIPVIGDLFFKGVNAGFYIGIIILIVAYIFLYKTKEGLRLRSCGENPHAADSLGVNIYHIRYRAVLISGFLAGAGGFLFAISMAKSFEGTVSGYGFLAIAVLIFGNWKPFRVLFAAFFFGLMTTIGAAYSAIPFLQDLNLSNDFYSMVPYIATLIVLALSSKSSRAPKAVGQVYDQGTR